MGNLNTFGVFLERMQQHDAKQQSRTRSATPLSVSPAEGDATKLILYSLKDADVVDPASLGVGFVELGRALERLQSLGGIVLTTDEGRQVVQRGAKYDDVWSLLDLK